MQSPEARRQFSVHGRCEYGHSLEEGSPSKFSVSSWLWVGYSTGRDLSRDKGLLLSMEERCLCVGPLG